MVEELVMKILNNVLKQILVMWRAQHAGPFVEVVTIAGGPEQDGRWETDRAAAKLGRST